MKLKLLTVCAFGTVLILCSGCGRAASDSTPEYDEGSYETVVSALSESEAAATSQSETETEGESTMSGELLKNTEDLSEGISSAEQPKRQPTAQAWMRCLMCYALPK